MRTSRESTQLGGDRSSRAEKCGWAGAANPGLQFRQVLALGVGEGQELSQGGNHKGGVGAFGEEIAATGAHKPLPIVKRHPAQAWS